jgi:structure-specific endonuclease subunit SLX1
MIRLNVTVNYFSTKYTKHSAGCPSLPEHMKVQVCPMDELPCYTEIDESLSENEDDWDNKEELDVDSIASGVAQETVPDSDSDSDSIDQNLVDYEDNINKTTDGLYKWSRELGEDCTQPFGFIKSQVRTSSSIVSGSFGIEEVAEDDRDMIKDSSVELHRPARNLLTTVVAGDKFQPPRSSSFVPCQVEIIDVSTPSPDCRTSLYGKKRRVSVVSPEIIDLTKSPTFIQL